MKKQLESTKSKDASASEAEALTDLFLTEASAKQIKGGPSSGDDLLIGGITTHEGQSGGSRHPGGVNVLLADGSVR